MTYLVDKYDTDRKISYAPGTPEYVEQTSWLMFQMAGLGPMQGAFIIHLVRVFKVLSHTIQDKRTISVSSPIRVPIMLLSVISTRRGASIRSSNRG